MRNIAKSGLREVLDERVLHAQVPMLGICLGAQLLGKGSEEGSEPGLFPSGSDTNRSTRTRRTAPSSGPNVFMKLSQATRLTKPSFATMYRQMRSITCSADEPHKLVDGLAKGEEQRTRTRVGRLAE